MKGSATGKVVDWANGEQMSKMIDQFSMADYSTFGCLLTVRYAINLIYSFNWIKSAKSLRRGLTLIGVGSGEKKCLMLTTNSNLGITRFERLF